MAKQSQGGPKTRKVKDLAMILDQTEDKEGFHVLRRRGEDAAVEVGTVRPLREGKAIDGEVVSLKRRRDLPFMFDVKTELADTRRPTSDGPAQVATEDYRRGWEAIWGGGPPVRGIAAKPN